MSRVILDVLSRHLSAGTQEINENLRLADASVKIQTEHLSNASSRVSVGIFLIDY
jgi:hypothetical protein